MKCLKLPGNDRLFFIVIVDMKHFSWNLCVLPLYIRKVVGSKKPTALHPGYGFQGEKLLIDRCSFSQIIHIKHVTST